MSDKLYEIKEAWDRINEYVYYVRNHPKSERDELDDAILLSYRQVLSGWFFSFIPITLFVKLIIYIIGLIVL